MKKTMEVKIELGHKAWKNIKPTKEGFTHDWSVFVRGASDKKIEHIVKKVIFSLPASYPDPIRIKEKPPYAVSESTSRSLPIQIDVFFYPEAKLKKVNYLYDIFISDEPVDVSWEKKLAFPDPSEEFIEKLLLAGGEPVDFLKAFPVLESGEFIKIKEEPLDEPPNVNNANETTLSPSIQRINNLENNCSEAQFDFNKLLEENKNLKESNIEMQEKIDLQKRLMTHFKENISRHEENISEANLGMNHLKKKIEDDEKEINILKLQVQMLQNRLLQIQSSQAEPPKRKRKGRVRERKNEESLNVSVVVGKEKENVAQPTNFTSALQNSPPLNKGFVSKENPNIHEPVKSNRASSVFEIASVSETAMELDDSCDTSLGNCSPSQSKDQTPSLNYNSSNQQNLCENQNKRMQIQNSQADPPKKKRSGRVREKKNKEILNVCVAVGKEKENVTRPMNFTRSSQNFPPLKKTFVSKNIPETAKSNSALSVVQNASVSETAMELDDSCNISSGNCSPSESKEETLSLNYNSHQQNVCKNQNLEYLDRSINSSSAINFSLQSANTCNFVKSEEGNLEKETSSLNKLGTKNIRKSVNKSSVEENSSLNVSEVKIIDFEKPAKRKWAKANFSLCSPEIIIIDDDENSAKKSSSKANASQNTSEVIVIDDEEYTGGMSCEVDVSLEKAGFKNKDIEKPAVRNSGGVNSFLNTSDTIVDAVKFGERSSAIANATLNKNNIHLKNNDGETLVVGTSFKNPASVGKQYNTKPCDKDKEQKQFATSMQEHHASSTESSNANSSNLNSRQNNKIYKYGMVFSLYPSDKKTKKKKNKPKKRKNLVKSSPLNAKPQSSHQTQKQLISPTEKTNISSSTTDSKENAQQLLDSGGDKSSSITLSGSIFLKDERDWKRRGHMKLFRDVYQTDIASINSKGKASHPDLDNSTSPKLIPFLTEYCLKLRPELDRIKNSEFSKHSEGLNALFCILIDIDNQISYDGFFTYLHSLIEYFSNPKTLDLPTLIYLVMDYLYSDRPDPESLFTYIENQDTCVFLLPSENCIVSALFDVEKKSLPHLSGLLKKTLTVLHQVIVSKKKMTPNGLASLCRVYMEICKSKNERWEPLFLCCELLRLEHPLAPFLINSLAAVWRVPFKLHDNFSVTENMLLGSIRYGIEVKPLLMDSDLWKLTLRLRSTYFPRAFRVNPHDAIQFLSTEIVSRCEKGLFQDIWMLGLPFIIFVSKESWEWKRGFRNGYLLPKLLQFSKGTNEQGFGVFCDLFVDILRSCPQSPYNVLQKYFTKTDLHQGKRFVMDCAAVAVLKYVGNTEKRVPYLFRDWFIKNQDIPQLAVIIDLYCKKVMESHDSFLLWEDIIIV